METQDKSKSLKNRTLKIVVTPSFSYDGSEYYPSGYDVTFTQKGDGTDPGMKSVVDANGNIDLTQMPKNDKYSENIDITFKLDDSELKDCNGNKVSAKWSDDQRGYQYDRIDGNEYYSGYGWFCPIDADGSLDSKNPMVPIPEGMSFERKSDDTLVLHDYSNDGKSHGWVIAFWVPDMQDYWMPLDPAVSSKGIEN